MTKKLARRAYRYHEFTGPIAPYRDSFIHTLEVQGFSRPAIHRQLRIVVRFSDWLQQHNVVATQVRLEHLNKFCLCEQWQHINRQGYAIVVRRVLDHLYNIKVISACQPLAASASPLDCAIEHYVRHLRHCVGLAELSITKYRPFVKVFLYEHSNGERSDLSTIDAADVMSYFTKLASTVSVSQAKSAATAIRSYFRYLNYMGYAKSDLVGAVPTVPDWSLSTVPRSISAVHAQQVLDHCPKQSAVGLRDYAILLLLAQLGLRSSEIVSLTLDSIDWDNSSISLVGKGRQPATLPITFDVGKALAAYLERGRPNCDNRALFLCGSAPIRRLGAATTVGTIVRAAIMRAGVKTTRYGSHQFRHALACSMIKGGATLDEVGGVLRHRASKTTRLYAKVDIDSLRTLCLTLPGEER